MYAPIKGERIVRGIQPSFGISRHVLLDNLLHHLELLDSRRVRFVESTKKGTNLVSREQHATAAYIHGRAIPKYPNRTPAESRYRTSNSIR